MSRLTPLQFESYRQRITSEYEDERARRGVPFGECFCQCGGKTSLGQENDASADILVGFPRRFIRGHAKKIGGPDYEVKDCGYKTPCWVWLKGAGSARYGLRYGVARRPGEKTPISAQRYVWEKIRGPVPPGTDLDHLCRNTLCCNPDHIEPVSHRENVRRGKNTQLTIEIAREIRRIRKEEGLLYKDIAAKFGITPSYAQMIGIGRKWPDD